MRYLKLFAFGLILLAFGCKSQQTATETVPTDDYLTLLHLNDVYEIAPIEGGKAGGMARVATLRQQLDTGQAQVYTFLAGDFLSPSVIGTVKIDGERVKGAQMVDVMNSVGFDFVVFGNHEFDLDEDELQSRIDESEFDWVAGNVLQKTPTGTQPFAQLGQPLPTSYVMNVSRASGDPMRVGVISLCLPANKRDFVYYEDFLESAQKQWDDLLPRTDFIVAVTHLSIDQDREVAKALPGLKLIMGGHEHENHYEVVGGVPIAKADANARTAYVHYLKFNRLNGEVRLRSDLIAINEEFREDPEVAAKVQDWEARAYAAFEANGLDLNATVASLPEPLDGLEAHIRTRQTNLGTAIATAMYQSWDSVDCAIANGGMVRLDDYLSGDITQFDLVRALPFGGQVIRVKMKGSLLRQVLEAGKSNIGSGGYLQLHLIEEKTGTWQVAGQPLDPEKVYSVAIGDFLLTGLEQNMGFLTIDNPGVLKVDLPESDGNANDVRLALAEYLKNR